MALGFSFNLEDPDGTPAEPPTFRSSVLTWRPGETIPLGRERFAWLSFEPSTPTSRPKKVVVSLESAPQSPPVTRLYPP
jgi:hypothetical protein